MVTGLYEPAKFLTKMRSLTDVKDLYKESYLVVPSIKFILVPAAGLEPVHP